MIPVTVLMAVYDGEQYLEETIASILEQDYRDFEFLIIDDASSDSTPDILAGAAAADPRIRIVRNHVNRGLTRSLNRGLAAARGDLVARIDADDLSRPGRLAAQKKFLDAHPECAVLGTGSTLIDDSGASLGIAREAVPREELPAQLFFRNPLTHSSVMFRRDVIVELGGYDESLTRAQDYDLWLRCLSAGYGLDMVADDLVCSRVHDGRVTINQTETMETCRIQALKRAFRDVLDLEVTDEQLLQLGNLRHRSRPVPPGRSRDLCRLLRRFRSAFAKRFPANRRALSSLDQTLYAMVDYLVAAEPDTARPYRAYITSRVPIASLTLYRGREKTARLIRRARIRLGAWRRRALRNDARVD